MSRYFISAAIFGAALSLGAAASAQTLYGFNNVNPAFNPAGQQVNPALIPQQGGPFAPGMQVQGGAQFQGAPMPQGVQRFPGNALPPITVVQPYPVYDVRGSAFNGGQYQVPASQQGMIAVPRVPAQAVAIPAPPPVPGAATTSIGVAGSVSAIPAPPPVPVAVAAPAPAPQPVQETVVVRTGGAAQAAPAPRRMMKRPAWMKMPKFSRGRTVVAAGQNRQPVYAYPGNGIVNNNHNNIAINVK